ncbi:MAG: recombination protein RecR [Verrucomicrobia bacterium]|nr:recombination protein RecR [Verrucomicrobiota bacterium]
MSSLPPPLLELIAALRKLPGIGPRSAERLALHLVQSEAAQVRQLADALVKAVETIVSCERCGALTEQQPCAICADARRDHSLACVVERATDVISIEKAGGYRGLYHVLGGRISPLNGIGPEDLRIGELVKRLAAEPIKEIILALPTDVEGDATGYYLAKLLREKNVAITRIAHGLPAGSGLEFADELTLSRAIEGRRELR